MKTRYIDIKGWASLLSLLLLAATPLLTACSDEEPFATAAKTDQPHILDPIFPDWVNGEPGTLAILNRDKNFNLTLTVTPADFTTVTWFIDGAPVAEGKTIDMPLLAGVYRLRVEATTTTGKSAWREAMLTVNALEGDPICNTVAYERIVAPSASATLYGENLSQVTSMLIGNEEVSDLSVSDDQLTYTVPANLASGTYRVVLVDADGQSYGGGQVTVTGSPLVTAGADRIGSNTLWTIQGINLSQVQTLAVDGQPIDNFISQSDDALTLTSPDLPVGSYTLTGTTKSGEALLFYVDGEQQTSLTLTITAEQTLWSGHHYVSWELEDGHPNKTFNFISKDEFAKLSAGTTLKIYYSLEPNDGYHQLRTTTGWWNDLPGTGTIDLASDGEITLTLTQEMLNMIQEQDGFLCVGHGYYVDLVSVK